MATIITIQPTDVIASSRADLNTNFANLNTDKAETTAPTFATSITGSYLTASEALITDTNKKIVSAPVATYPSLAELAYLKGATSSVQAQITARALKGANSDITSLTGLTTPLTVAQGGVGVATLDDHYVLIGSGTSAITPITPDIAGKVLTSNGVGADPSFQSQLVGVSTFKNGVTTYDIATADGTQDIAHGCGATPKKIKITCMGPTPGNYAINSKCYFVYNGTTASSLYESYYNGSTHNNSSSTIIIQTDTNIYTTGTVTIDATNISIAWVKTGSPTGQTRIMWEAEV